MVDFVARYQAVMSRVGPGLGISILTKNAREKNLESIVDVQLNAEEQEKFNQSTAAVKNMNEALKDVLK